MNKITKRQGEILDFIIAEVRERGFPPSVREIGDAVGLASSSTVHGHLTRLEAAGHIRRDPTKPRAIEILNEAGIRSDKFAQSIDNVVQIPVVGKVTAGAPIEAIEHTEEFFPIPRNMTRDGDITFILEISGDSMIEAGIFDGDKVIVRKQSSANNGDIVIAMTEDNEATCKRFFKEANHIRLQPENAALEPIIVPRVTILGLVTGLYRETIH